MMDLLHPGIRWQRRPCALHLTRRLHVAALAWVLVQFWIPFPLPAHGQEEQFGNPPAWFSGRADSTLSVVLGDVDSDGDLDLVCGNLFQKSTLYLNEGGTFSRTPAWFSGRARTTSVVLGDVDGDADLDLVCGNYEEPTTLYLNVGGTFDSSSVWSSDGPYLTRSVALGDVDGDGDLDLVCGNEDQPTRLYLNVDGTFDHSSVWRSDTLRTTSVALGDVDGDGALDLVCGNDGQPTSLYLNVAGTLDSSSVWSPDPLPTTSVALGDVNGDGRLDLVCGNRGQNTVLYLNVDSTFALAPLPPSDPGDTRSVALGDVDGDGDLDLVIGNEAQSTTLYINAADGLFDTAPIWSSDRADPTWSVALGDVDSDGALDLVCGNRNQSTTLYRNSGSRFDTSPSWFSQSHATASVALGDVDADGDPDLVCGTSGESAVLYRNDEGVLRGSPTWFSAQSDTATTSVTLGDVDQDGALDLVCGNSNARTILYRNLRNNQEISFSPIWSSEPNDYTRSVVLGDVDGDGAVDLVCGNDGQCSKLYRNEGGMFSPTPVWHTAIYRTWSVALGDVDGDRDLDLVCGNLDQNTTLYLNEGGTFSSTPAWSSDRAERTTSVVLGDVDADGDLDLVCGNKEESTTLYLNESGTLARTPVWFSGRTDPTLNVQLGDVDGDGDLDLVCGNYNQRTTLYLNDGGMFRSTPVWFSEADKTQGGALGDVDGDGDLDLVCGNEGVTKLYLGTSNPPFKGNPLSPIHQLPNTDGFVRFASAEKAGTNLYHVIMTIVDVESDPVRVLPEWQFRGGKWNRADVASGGLGRLQASPGGIDHEFEWDLSRLPRDRRDVVLRLRAISSLSRVGVIQHTGSYVKEIGEVETVQPWIVVSPANLRLPVVTVGDSTSVEFSIANGGNAPLTVTQFELPSSDMRITPPAPLGIPPGVAEPLRLVLSGRQAGNVSGLVQISSNDPLDPVLPIGMQARLRSLDFSVNNLYPEGEIQQGETLLLSLTMQDSTDSDSVKVFYRPAGATRNREIRLQFIHDPPRDQYTGAIPADSIPPRGVEYFPVVYNGTAAVEGRISRLQVRVKELTFPAAQPAGRYRIVSVPLETEGTALDYLIDDLGSLQPSQWRMFAYEPPVYHELTPSGLFSFEQGHAYWLISRQPVTMDVGPRPPAGVTAPSDSGFMLVLEPGWNLVSNPFNFPVAWTAVTVPDSVGSLTAFDPTRGEMGDYLETPPAVLQPFEGYFIKNAASHAETVWVPPVEAPESLLAVGRRFPPSKTTPAKPMSLESWVLRLQAKSARGLDGSNLLGVDAVASEAYDRLDLAKAPSPPGSWVRAGFAHWDWGGMSDLYRCDMRGPGTEGHLWEIEVRCQEEGGEVTLELSAVAAVPEGLAIRLLDREQDASVDLKEPGDVLQYKLVPYGPDRVYHLTLLAGLVEFVARESRARVELPTGVILDQNGPNPFRQSTRIRFGLPEAGRSKLEIYNVRGQRVATLVPEQLVPAGYQTATWNGTDAQGRRLASGIYLCRLTAGSTILTRRLVLLR